MALNQTNREVVSIGIDFRPIPVDIGDGKIWNFDPDPAPDKWDNLNATLMKFQSLQNVDQDNIEELKLSPLLTDLRKALGGLLADREQEKEWNKTTYGLMPLQSLAQRVMEQITGFPTNQDSNSGE